MALVEYININEVLELKENDPLVTSYLKRLSDRFKNAIPCDNVFNEISTYEGIVGTISKSIRYHLERDINPFIIFGYLLILTRSNYSFLFPTSKRIELLSDASSEISGFEGIEVMKGSATPFELTKFYYDVLRACGVNAYFVDSETKSLTGEVNPIKELIDENKTNRLVEPLSPRLFNCCGSENGIIVRYHDTYYLINAKDITISKLDKGIAYDMFSSGYQTTSPLSLMVYENMDMDSIRNLYEKMNVNNVVSKDNILLYIKDGMEDAKTYQHNVSALLNPLVAISIEGAKKRLLNNN